MPANPLPNFDEGQGLDRDTLATGIFQLLVNLEKAGVAGANPLMVKKMMADGLADLIDGFVRSGKISTTVELPLGGLVVSVDPGTHAGANTAPGTSTGDNKIE